MRLLRSCLVALAIGAASASAHAQDLAAAEALFNKGLADMDAGKFDTACPALAESYRIDPRPGTLFTVADCENKAGKIATAVARYEDYLSAFGRMTSDQQSKQKGREKIAAEQKAALAPHVPQLTLVLPQTAPKGTVVRRDDIVLGQPSLGIALPVDPGDHVLATEVPGGKAHEQKITIARDEKKTVELEIDLGGPAGAVPPPASSSAPGPLPFDSGSDAGQSGSSRKTVGFVVGGVGAAALVLGAIMGGVTLGKKSKIDDNCDGTKCNHAGKQAADSAKTTGLVSTIGFAVGIAGLGAGAILILTAPHTRKEAAARRWQPALSIGPDGASGGVKGAF